MNKPEIFDHGREGNRRLEGNSLLDKSHVFRRGGRDMGHPK
jgi:hypothetical protein